MAHHNALCNFAFSILDDKDMAKDVVQDVFLNLWQKRDQLNIDTDVKSYLFTSTRNKCIEFIRKMKLVKKYEDFVRQTQSNEFNIEEDADKYMRKERLYASIRQLPPKCKEVFLMSKQNGLTYSEIADELSISPKTVENHMGRALRLLREMLLIKTK